MDKKENLLTILKELFGVFHLAESLYEYVQDNVFEESIIDGIIGLFRDEIENISNEEQKNMFQSIIEKLEIIRQKEIVDIKKDHEEALRIIALIS